jgi:hypothetical protein
VALLTRLWLPFLLPFLVAPFGLPLFRAGGAVGYLLLLLFPQYRNVFGIDNPRRFTSLDKQFADTGDRQRQSSEFGVTAFPAFVGDVERF